MGAKTDVVLNITLCVFICIFAIIDIINAYEYYFSAQFYNKFFQISILFFIIAHPLILFCYHIISLFYMAYIPNTDFAELIGDFEYLEMIFFRNLVTNNIIWVFPLSIYLTFISYFKFFSLYSIKFVIELPSNPIIYKNVITTTLHSSLIIHCIFQSLPQIILQSTNNLAILEDKHDYEMKGVVNFYSIVSLIMITFMIILYIRERKIAKSKDIEEKINNTNSIENVELM